MIILIVGVGCLCIGFVGGIAFILSGANEGAREENAMEHIKPKWSGYPSNKGDGE